MNQDEKRVQTIKNEHKRITKCNETESESQNQKVSFNDSGNKNIKQKNSTKIFPSIHRQCLYKKVNNQQRKNSLGTNTSSKIDESSKSNNNLEIKLNNELLLGNDLSSSLSKNTYNGTKKCTPYNEKYVNKKKRVNILKKDDKMEVIYLNNLNEKQSLIQSDEKVIDNYKKRFIFDNKKKNSNKNSNSNNNLNENRKLSINNNNSNAHEIGVQFSNSITNNKRNKKQKIFINLKATAPSLHKTSNDNFLDSNQMTKNLNGSNKKLIYEKSNNLDDSSKEIFGSIVNENMKSSKTVSSFCGGQKLNTNENKIGLNLLDKKLEKTSSTKGKSKSKNSLRFNNKDLGINYKKTNSNRNNAILNYTNKNIQSSPSSQNKIHNTNKNLNINYYSFNSSNLFQNGPDNSKLNVVDNNFFLPNEFTKGSIKLNSTDKISDKKITCDVNNITTPKKSNEINRLKQKMDLKIKPKKLSINTKNNTKNNQGNIQLIEDSYNKITPRMTIKYKSNKAVTSFKMSQVTHYPPDKDKAFNTLDINETKQRRLKKINYKLKKGNPSPKKLKDPAMNKVVFSETDKKMIFQKRKNTPIPSKDMGKNFFAFGLIDSSSNSNSISLKNEKSKYESNSKLLSLYNYALNDELKEMTSNEEDAIENITNNYSNIGSTLNTNINSSKKMKNDEYFDINLKEQSTDCDKKYLNNSQNDNKSVKNRIINYKTVNRAINIKNPIKSSSKIIKRKNINYNDSFKFNGSCSPINQFNLLLKMPKKVYSTIFKYFDLKSLNTVCLLNKKYNNCFKKIKNTQIRKFVNKLGGIPYNKNSNIIKKSLFKYSDLSKLSQPILQKKYLDLLYEDNFADNDIKKDLTRTYPDDELFKKGNAYYNKLYHLLTVYANYNQNIKYAQGLNFLAANTIYYFEKEIDEFVFLDGLIHKFELQNLLGCSNYLNEKLESLNIYIKKKCPNTCKYFDEMGLNYSFFTTNWVVTLFSNSMSKNHLSLIWDYMIIYGWKFFNCFIVAVLNLYENKIIRVEQNQLMALMKNILKNEDFCSDFSKIIENTFYFIDNEKNILLY